MLDNIVTAGIFLEFGHLAQSTLNFGRNARRRSIIVLVEQLESRGKLVLVEVLDSRKNRRGGRPNHEVPAAVATSASVPRRRGSAAGTGG